MASKQQIQQNVNDTQNAWNNMTWFFGVSMPILTGLQSTYRAIFSARRNF